MVAWALTSISQAITEAKKVTSLPICVDGARSIQDHVGKMRARGDIRALTTTKGAKVSALVLANYSSLVKNVAPSFDSAESVDFGNFCLNMNE